MTEYDLRDLGGLRWEHTERVVPKTGSNHKPETSWTWKVNVLDLEWVLPAVDSSDKTVRFHPDLLWEVVSQVPSSLLPRTVGHNSQDGVHREREVHRAGALVRVRWRLGWCWTKARITFAFQLLLFFLQNRTMAFMPSISDCDKSEGFQVSVLNWIVLVSADFVICLESNLVHLSKFESSWLGHHSCSTVIES